MEEKVQSVEPLGVVVVDVGKERLVLAAQSSRCIQSRLTNRMFAARRRLSTLHSERSPVPFLGLVFLLPSISTDRDLSSLCFQPSVSRRTNECSEVSQESRRRGATNLQIDISGAGLDESPTIIHELIQWHRESAVSLPHHTCLCACGTTGTGSRSDWRGQKSGLWREKIVAEMDFAWQQSSLFASRWLFAETLSFPLATLA